MVANIFGRELTVIGEKTLVDAIRVRNGQNVGKWVAPPILDCSLLKFLGVRVHFLRIGREEKGYYRGGFHPHLDVGKFGVVDDEVHVQRARG
mmetsp:Transcript_36573/g.42502  ORF Transcript_36573/g.42502 Transcript_36573/m.42502 type:complete len:92 (-) Transcript_36573:390-665(-)